MMKGNCKIVDAWAQHAVHPTTFAIPSTKELMHLKVGDYVKLGVIWKIPVTKFPARSAGGERFWVKVTELPILKEYARLSGAVIRGVVEQSDIHFPETHGIKDGEEITFGPPQIMAILTARQLARERQLGLS